MKRGIACLLFALCSSGFAAVPSADQLLPEDTLGLISVPDVAAANAYYEGSPMRRLFRDPSMKPFADKLLDKLSAEVVEPLEREFGIKFSDYAGLARGQVTLAVTRSGWEGKPDQRPGFVFLLDAKERSGALAEQLAALKTKWVDSGKKLKTEQIRDVEFTTLMFKLSDLERPFDQAFADKGDEPGPPDDADGEEISWLVGQSESLLILGDHAADIEKVLIRLSGGSVPSLAANAVFAANQGALFRRSLGYAWVNAATLISIASKNLPKDPQAGGLGAFNPGDLLEPLGVNGLESLAWSMRSTSAGCLIDGLVGVPAGKRKGLFELFSFEALEAGPPVFVPADTMKFSRFRLDVPRTWNGLEAMLERINAQLAGVLKLLVDTAGKDKDPDFDLRKNLIANLGNDLITVEKPPGEASLAALAEPPTMFLVGSPDPQQLASALRALSGLLPATGAQPKERDFLGRKVYSIPLPGGGDGEAKSLHYSASGGYVALSTDVAMLEGFLRSGGDPGEPLRGRSGFAQAAEEVGGLSTGLFGYGNQKEEMKLVFQALKKESGGLASLFSGSPLGGQIEENDKLKEWVDFSLLPEFDRVAKYFHFSVWAGRVTPMGFRMQFFAPDPPEL